MPQFSPGVSSASLTTRLKDGCFDVSTGVTSNASHMSFMQQQQPAAKSLEVAHSSTSLYADVSSSTTSMSMVSLSSDGPAAASNNSYPPSSQLGTNSRDACGLCSGSHSDRIASHCGHRFHAQCLHTWGGLTTCPMCAHVRSFYGLCSLCCMCGINARLCWCRHRTLSLVSRSAMVLEQIMCRPFRKAQQDKKKGR